MVSVQSAAYWLCSVIMEGHFRKRLVCTALSRAVTRSQVHISEGAVYLRLLGNQCVLEERIR